MNAKTAVSTMRERLSPGIKLVYGTGDWSMASYNTLRLIFYAIFLTDVVGLDARLASFVTLIGVAWDAINDPLVGFISDRVHSRWGRRRPFFLIFAVPFGLSFMLLWWAPPWQSQIALAVTCTLALMISDTLQTLVVVPFLSLTPELTPDYDERTSLTSFRMFFNLVASLLTAAGAPMILQAMLEAGYAQQQAYLLIAALFGGLATLPFLAMFAFLRERKESVARPAEQISLRENLRLAWGNVPFRYATALNAFNWITFDLVALMLPFFLTYWVAEGNLLAKVDLFGMQVALQSAVLGILFGVAILFLPFWTWVARRSEKRLTYIAGMAFWGVVLLATVLIQPGATQPVLLLAVLSGISASTAHVLPDAIFPDVVEWDELRTGRRHEGVYYGAKNFTRKLTGALAGFLALQVMGWFGYQSPPSGALQFSQPPSALTAIRALTGPVGALLLLGAIAIAWFYPITRKRYARIRVLLARRRARSTVG